MGHIHNEILIPVAPQEVKAHYDAVEMFPRASFCPRHLDAERSFE